MIRIKYIISFLLISNILAAQNSNSWTQKADFPGSARGGATAFSIDSFGYIALGGYGSDTIAGYRYPIDFWQYNPYTNIWVQKASFPGPGRTNAVAFVISSKAYVGMGDEDGIAYSDFWEYDPAMDTWSQVASFSGGPRILATGFSAGSKGYTGLGIGNLSIKYNDLWQYDPAANTWTQKADFAGDARWGAIGCSIHNTGYIGLGIDSYYIYKRDFWQYDTLSDSWTQRADYPGRPIIGLFTFTIADRLYMGEGYDSIISDYYGDFWEYNSLTDQWIEKDSFDGAARQGAGSFSIGNKGYVGTGSNPSLTSFPNDFWQYTPDSIATGIISIHENNISIYPDPAIDNLYISNLPPNATLTITDITGRLCATPPGSDIDVSALPAGVYCLRMQDSGGTAIRKFVKE